MLLRTHAVASVPKPTSGRRSPNAPRTRRSARAACACSSMPATRLFTLTSSGSAAAPGIDAAKSFHALFAASARFARTDFWNSDSTASSSMTTVVSITCATESVAPDHDAIRIACESATAEHGVKSVPATIDL
jgi:hypothetical protein